MEAPRRDNTRRGDDSEDRFLHTEAIEKTTFSYFGKKKLTGAELL